MAIEVITTGYGAPALDALRDAVARNQGGDALRPVTVIVPTNIAGVVARRALARRAGGIAAVTFLTVRRLAEALGAQSLAASGRRPASAAITRAALRAELDSNPGAFEAVAHHEATEDAFARIGRELRLAGDAAALRLRSLSPRAGEVVRILAGARRRLARDWYDEVDLLDSAVAALSTADLGSLGPVVLHIPQELSVTEARLVGALADHVPVTVVAALTGFAHADAGLHRSLGLIGAVAGEVPPAEAPVTAIGTTDADEEARTAVRAVVAAAGRGIPFDRMAILHPGPAPYPRLLAEHLSLADVPWNGRGSERSIDSVAGRLAVGLLELSEGDFERDALFHVLASAPIVDRSADAVPVPSWERASRAAGVVAGRDEFDTRLGRYATARQAEADQHHQLGDEIHAERLAREAAAARGLRRFALTLYDELASLGRARTWRDRSATLHTLIHRYLAMSGVDADRVGLDRLTLALDRLGQLDGIGVAVDPARYRRSLVAELADAPRRGRIGEGVLVESLTAAVGLELDLVVVVGLAEGTLPPRLSDDALVPDRERALAGLVPRAELSTRAERHVFAARADSAEMIVVWARGDLRAGAERRPSPLVATLAPCGEHVVASHAAALRNESPVTEQQARIQATVAESARHPGRAGVRARAARRARYGAEFSEYSGNLTSLGGAPVGVMSASRLERWLKCPLGFFVRDELGIDAIENPEEALQPSPLDKGSLVHQVLDDFVSDWLHDASVDHNVPPIWSLRRDRLQEMFVNACRRLERDARCGRPVLWRREQARMWADLLHTLRRDELSLRNLGAVPIASEYRFGFDTNDEFVEDVGGRTVRLRGSIDRVDRGADGRLHVIDYKTGKDKGFTGVTAGDLSAGGRLVQLVIYALAARRHFGGGTVRATYRFVSLRKSVDERGGDVGDDAIAAWRDTVGAIVAAMEAGLFPARPEEHYSFNNRPSCPACDPDGVGADDAVREWNRYRADPVLARYMALIGEDTGRDGP